MSTTELTGYETTSGSKLGEARAWKARMRWKATAYSLEPILRANKDGMKRRARRVMVYCPFVEASAIGCGAADDEAPKVVPPMFWQRFRCSRKPAKVEIADFLEAMGSSIESGASEGDALRLSASSAASPRMRGIIGALVVLISNGVPLSDAMELFPEAFPKMVCSLVRASELAGGKKGSVFMQMSQRMTHDNKLTKKFVQAMVYPIIVVTMATAAAIVLNIKALPPMVNSFKDMGAKLPAITEFFYKVSTFLTQNVYFIIPGVILAVFLLVKFGGKIFGHPFTQSALLKFPYFGPVLQGLCMARGLEAMAMLKKAGAVDRQIYSIAGDASGNLIYKRYFTAIFERISAGASPEDAFLRERDRVGKDGLRVASKLKIGAFSGDIEPLLEKTAQELRDRTDQRLQVLPQLMEIPLLAICGTIVGSIILAIFLPIPSLIIDVMQKQNG